MRIRAENLSKRFKVDWIIKNFDYSFESGMVYGLSGPNGSGKTTLLHILAGLVPPSRGRVVYETEDALIADEQWYRHLSYAAPYAEVYEYMNLRELFVHHTGFRPLYGGMAFGEFVATCYLQGHEDKQIRAYSSGMKQRLKLALGILTHSELLFLDEPQTNLDERAREWYFELLAQYRNDRCVIIASNEPSDFSQAGAEIKLGI